MQDNQDKNKARAHDVDEHNRDENEKTPPGSFTGTNIDRYVTGEISQNPLEEEDLGKEDAQEDE